MLDRRTPEPVFLEQHALDPTVIEIMVLETLVPGCLVRQTLLLEDLPWPGHPVVAYSSIDPVRTTPMLGISGLDPQIENHSLSVIRKLEENCYI